MTPDKREFWWLVALQASLCFSLSSWEATAPWAEPASYPTRFVIVLISGVSAATLACHVGPALFAARFGGRANRFTGALSLWLAAGYIEWLLSIVGGQRGVTSLATTAMFLATLLCAGLVKAWWKPVTAIGSLVGAGILIWALAANWHGLWVRNPHYGSDPVQLDWVIFQGVLISTAPAVVIGWRIGWLEPRPRRIWLSGFVGVWLPAVVSVAIASFADQAGANLYWVPSLFRGFYWALEAPHKYMGQSVTTLAIWTLLLPALVSMISLRQLVPPWTPRRNVWLVPIGVGLFALAVTSISLGYQGWPFSTSLFFFFSTAFHQFWAWSLVILGAAAALRCAVRPH